MSAFDSTVLSMGGWWYLMMLDAVILKETLQASSFEFAATVGAHCLDIEFELILGEFDVVY
jgi:hypothetical protein